MKPYTTALAGICLSLVTANVSAQIEDDLALMDEDALLFQDIPSVYSASKYEQKVTEAPSWVSIITARDIELYGYRTLGDILSSLAGFYINYDRNYSYLGVRGFGLPGDYNSRVQLLINGHQVNDNIYSSAATERAMPLNLDLIERIEVVRGPSSSLYGSNAFFGVINIITKSGRDLETTQITASYGSQASWETAVHYGERFSNGAEVLVSATYYSSDGDTSLYYPEFDTPADNNGIAENADAEESEQVFLQYDYKDFSLSFAHSSRDKNIPTASYYTVFNDPRTLTTDATEYLDLKYQTLLDNDAELLVRMTYDEYAYYGDYVYDYGPPPDIVVNRDEVYGDSWGGEMQYSFSLAEKHQLITGIDYQKNFRQDLTNFDIYGVYLDEKRDSYQWGAYIQDEYQLNDKWIINLGLRHDESNTTDSSLNPRLGLIYQLDSMETLKFMYGTAFRAPNAYELYYNDGGASIVQTDGLVPEEIESFELVYEKISNTSLHWVVSVYRNKIENLIALEEYPPDTLLVWFQNVGEAKTRGADVEIIKKFVNKLELTASLSIQKTEDMAGTELVNSPRNMAKLLLSQPILGEDVLAALEVQYQDQRRSVSGDVTGDYFLANLNFLARELVKGLTLSFGIYNLFDEDYFYPGSEEHLQSKIQQDGRLLRLKVNYSF